MHDFIAVFCWAGVAQNLETDPGNLAAVVSMKELTPNSPLSDKEIERQSCCGTIFLVFSFSSNIMP